MKPSISNPCKWFISGNDQIEFKHGGGSTPYHFCSVDSGFTTHYAINVLFFADNPAHAKVVLLAMLAKNVEAADKYIKRLLPAKDRRVKEFRQRYEYRAKLALEIINAPEKIIITEAPRDQFYTIGWADNDTIL